MQKTLIEKLTRFAKRGSKSKHWWGPAECTNDVRVCLSGNLDGNNYAQSTFSGDTPQSCINPNNEISNLL